MTKVTDLPSATLDINNTTATNELRFIVTENKLTRRLSFPNLLTALQTSFYGAGQTLTPISDVRFATVSAFLGSYTNVQVRNNLSVGSPVDLDFDDGDIKLTNENAPKNTTLLIRGYTFNYVSTGQQHPVLLGELAENTDELPNAVLNGKNIFTVGAGGYSGRNWTDARNQFAGRITFYATENWNDTITTTTNVGTGFYIATHPNGVILDRNQNYKQIHIHQSWETEGQFPVPNITIGSGIEGYKTLIRANGTTFTHEGSTKLKFLNTRFTIDGVVPEDTSPDNVSLLDSNSITFIGSRRSATSLRRNAVKLNDTIGKLQFRGMNANTASISNTGTIAGEVKLLAVEDYTSTATGSRFVISTINSGTVISSNRLNLTNKLHIYSSDKHTFTDSQGNTIGVISTGTDTSFLSSRINLTTSTIDIVSGDTSTVVLSAYKTYVLSKVVTNVAAWVRIYTDSASQLADFSRPYGTTVTTGINLITEVVTTSGSLSKVIAPGIIGFNNDSPAANIVYLTLTNNSSTNAAVTASLSVLKLEI